MTKWEMPLPCVRLSVIIQVSSTYCMRPCHHQSDVRKESFNMSNMRVRLGLLLLVGILVVTAALMHIFLRPLPLPCRKSGRVVNAETGEPVVNATLEIQWTLYDYPMMDGAGAYHISTSTTTDANGKFVLTVPRHRRGLWNTESYPPIVRADGYHTFADWPDSVRYNGNSVTIPLKPLKP